MVKMMRDCLKKKETAWERIEKEAIEKRMKEEKVEIIQRIIVDHTFNLLLLYFETKKTKEFTKSYLIKAHWDRILLLVDEKYLLLNSIECNKKEKLKIQQEVELKFFNEKFEEEFKDIRFA